MRPGEISLASAGVLFLDELGEFPVSVLEALRQPLEEGVVRISRANASATMPARFQLVAAMNPCPCGEGLGEGSCRCSDAARARYARRLSGPLLDRFDLRIEVTAPDPSLLLGFVGGWSETTDPMGAPGEETTAVVAGRVQRARAVANARGVLSNAHLTSEQIERFAPLSVPAARLAERALVAGELTGRGLRRARSVARTIADLQGQEDGAIGADELQLALSLRVRPFSVLGGVR